MYAIIYGLSHDGESVFRGTRKYLAEWCNATERGIQKNLNNLIERNLIEQVTHTPNNHLVCYKVTNWVASEQSSPLVVNKVHDDKEQSSLAYNKLEDSIIDKLDNTSTKVEVEPPKGDSVNDTEVHGMVLENHTEGVRTNIYNRAPQKILTKEKSKKPNLWDKCFSEIHRRYKGTKVYDPIIEYLGYRIKSDMHPLGYSGWVGLLNKLDKLGKTDDEKCKIIEQSIKMKWDTFTELKQWNNRNSKYSGTDVFAEGGFVKSVPADRNNFMKGVKF